MKATKLTFGSFMLVLLILIFSCTINESNPLKEGEWKITQCNINESNPFLDFKFKFYRKSVSASKRTNFSSLTKENVEIRSFTSVSGAYSIKTNHDKRTLFFDFGTASPLDKLNYDWLMIEETPTKITLQHIKENHIFLVFEKTN